MSVCLSVGSHNSTSVYANADKLHYAASCKIDHITLHTNWNH